MFRRSGRRVLPGVALMTGACRHEEAHPEQTGSGIYCLWTCSVAVVFALLLYLIVMAGIR
jgi:hypothetical protein